MKIFKINDRLSVVAEWQKTRNGFRHVVHLMEDGQDVLESKATYLNRTWESFEYETALRNLLDKAQKEKALPTEDLTKFETMIKNRGQQEKEEAQAQFKSIAMVAKMGEVLAPDQKSKNEWKERMIKAGLGAGIDMPEDWDTLSEDEKEKRLDAVIEHLQGEKKKGLFAGKKAQASLTMTKFTRLGSKGSGWHKEPISHSYATKFGKAPKHVRGR